MECIVCSTENECIGIEHIVSESFGNRWYMLPKGAICDNCNHRFSKFEGPALSNSIFAMERARLGVETKKGRNVKGRIGDLELEGNKEFEKNLITVKKFGMDSLRDFDPETGKGKLYVSAFDKSEVATCKLLLKMGLESMWKSQKVVFAKYNFETLKRYLTNQDNVDWPFLTTNSQMTEFKSIPTFNDKYQLGRIRCQLKFSEVDNDTLLFKFSYGSVSMLINLMGRGVEWTTEYLNQDDVASLYPKHFRNKQSKAAISRTKGIE